MYFGMLRGDRHVAAYVHGPQGQVLGAFRFKTIQKINCKEINAKIMKGRKKERNKERTDKETTVQNK
jgi:predicted transcriptional regulator